MAGLGVGISHHKSHESKDTYEFAKRWYRDGIEVTGAQLRAFTNNTKWYSIANEVKE